MEVRRRKEEDKREKAKKNMLEKCLKQELDYKKEVCIKVLSFQLLPTAFYPRSSFQLLPSTFQLSNTHHFKDNLHPT